MNIVLTLFLSQIVSQIPILVVHLFGVILAVALWRRCPRPAALTLVATALLLLTTLGQSFLSAMLINARAELDWQPIKVAWATSTIVLVGSMIRAVAYCILLAAVFVGRKRSPPPVPG